MKWGKWLLAVSLGLVFFALSIGKAVAADKVYINLFHLSTCPHCHDEIEFLEDYKREDPDIEVREFEVTKLKNKQLWQKIGQIVGAEVGPVPLTVIGSQYIDGFGTASTTGVEIKEMVAKAREESWPDIVGDLIVDSDQSFEDKLDKWQGEVKQKEVPKEISILGKKIKVEGMSLPMLTVVLGIVDGFNPCAMWILLFLISLLLNMDNRLKMWLLGGTFIFVSGLMYFLVMSAWLNLFLLVGLVVWVRWVIGGFAVGAGGWQIKLWWEGRGGGCETTDEERRTKMFTRVKKVIYEEKLWLSLIGIAVLAIGVNVFELMCSAGLPALFTSVLSANNLPGYQYYLYILGYVVLFMIDDLIVFTIAMITLKATGIQSKYANWARLIGGVVMLWIGYAMLFKPEMLTF